MARGVNKATILGNVGQEPDVRFLPNGNPVCNLRIATSEQWTDKQSGQKQERTEWHSIVLFNKLAEIAQQYVHKGSKIYIEGKLQTRKWQGQDGQDRYSTEIVASELQLLDSKGSGGDQQQRPQQQGQQNQSRGTQQGGPSNSRAPRQNGYDNASNNGAPDPSSFDDFEDEIPF